MDSKTEGEIVSKKAITLETPFGNKLYYLDSNCIKTICLETGNISTLKIVQNAVGSLEVVNNTVYWTEKNLPIIKSSSKSRNVWHTNKLKSQAIAFDYVTKNFYIIDKLADTVNVIDEEGKRHGIILSDVEKPHDIVIDVSEGVMFVTQQFKAVRLQIFEIVDI